MAKAYDPAATRAAVEAVRSWVEGRGEKPARAQLAKAVRQTVRALEHDAPGHTVEVRVPPFVAVQCIEGPKHTRGTPPNVVETDPLTWLQLATGRLSFAEGCDTGRIAASGQRAAEVGKWLPVIV